jgi:uncharacterized membrane protein YphA (DoxX/SURF4 family)
MNAIYPGYQAWLDAATESATGMYLVLGMAAVTVVTLLVLKGKAPRWANIVSFALLATYYIAAASLWIGG